MDLVAPAVKMEGVGSTTRQYKGRTAEERREERRQRLLAAGLELWGDHGWAAVTMRGVCAHAGLNDRYFYESFPDVEALLLAVFDESLAGLIKVMEGKLASAPREPSARIRFAMSAFIKALSADPRRARIGLAEPAGSPALEQRRRDTYHLFARMAREDFGAPDDLAILFALGGVGELVISWLGGALPVSAEQLVDRATALVVATISD